jgi:ATP adenylyltransferase
MTYIENPHKQEDDCAFCSALGQTDCSQNLILFRGRMAFVILNMFPYTSGHLMVVPVDHQPSLEQLSAENRGEMMELVTRCIEVLKDEYKPQGFNVGINIGTAAGAGIAEHVHIHIVPRWTGDTNFMSSLGQTRVLPESLEDTYQRLKVRWEQEELS